MRQKYPHVAMYHEDRPDIPMGTLPWHQGQCMIWLDGVLRLNVLVEPIDLVLTLGGDGTILHASSLFRQGAVPPVLSFSMGTLGFLLPFRMFILHVFWNFVC